MAPRLCLTILLLTLALSLGAQKPNIVFIISDDLGYADLGIYNNDQIHTPNINHILEDGVRLDNYYVLPVCRRYPIRYGLQNYVINHDSAYGLHLNETTLPQLLQRSGYTNHAVGKWHQGFYTWKHTPTFRGFESFYGFYTGGQDYYTHKSGEAFDFRFDKQRNCGLGCDEVLYNTSGQYSTELFSQRAVEVIRDHDLSKPLFLYLAYQAVHDPSEVPDRYITIYKSSIQDVRRRRFAAMVSCMDEGVGNVTQALNKRGMLNNTLIVFTTDNGGPITEANCSMCGDFVGSSNYPLRGGKHSYYEGGLHGVAGMIGLNFSKAHYGGLMHTTDWLPTIASLAGLNITGQTYPLDGVDQLQSIRENRTVSPRSAILHNIEMTPQLGPRGIYFEEPWKIIAGPGGPPYTRTPIPQMLRRSEAMKRMLRELSIPEDSAVELYNVTGDLWEQNNRVESHEDVALRLLGELRKYQIQMFPGYNPYVHDPRAKAAWVNNTWMPWSDVE